MNICLIPEYHLTTESYIIPQECKCGKNQHYCSEEIKIQEKNQVTIITINTKKEKTIIIAIPRNNKRNKITSTY